MEKITQLLALFTAVVIPLVAVQSGPVASAQTSVSETYVYVCADSGSYRCGSGNEYGPISYEGNYVPRVLANEWPGQAGSEALKAGAVAIRTFGWRDIPCGAVWGHRIVGGTEYRIEHTGSQAYWGCCTPQTRHYDAVNATAGNTLRNHSTYNYICAKYKADCGNPTADGADEPWTLVSVPDPVDSDNGGYYLAGLSQNGSHAWELSGYAGAAPWDYRQILAHYYAQVTMRGLTFNRWAWLDADTAGGIRYTGLSGEQYYGPLARTPRTMQTGLAYQVPFHLQNTSPYQWNSSGSYSEQLSYHWYDSAGRLVTWEGLRTSLGADVYPSRNIQLQAKVVAPFYPGTYTLKWDMVSETYWFSEGYGGWPTQNVVVNVQPSADLVFLTYIRNSGGWVSTITVRNNSTSVWASADVTYIAAGGAIHSSTSYLIPPSGVGTATPPPGFFGSAVVAATQDITVNVQPSPKQVFLPLALKNY